jgi:hypothetical protein
MELGWQHWTKSRRRPFGPENVSVDLWPDLSEYDADEKYPTPFKYADGSTAELFSSANRKTVLRHFTWMKDYGIDGAFVQRFANGLRPGSDDLHHKNTVLAHAREGANQNGRAYALMYDLSGLSRGETQKVFTDWRMLRENMQLGKDPAYLHHRGKPLVAIWGMGFDDERKYTLQECRELVVAFKADGCSIMLGIPTWWRELKRDAVPDPALHDLLKMADVISPWTVGRYRSPEEATRHGKNIWAADRLWATERNVDFMPVVFPGFSWHNLTNGASPLGDIPRLGGKFLWSQFQAAKNAEADMVYVAMFDEVDEGTAIFKCSNHPPVGKGVHFLSYKGVPNDHYLTLTGKGGKLIRGEPLE